MFFVNLAIGLLILVVAGLLFVVGLKLLNNKHNGCDDCDDCSDKGCCSKPEEK